jgi:long-chain acyl-CoA synthetase
VQPDDIVTLIYTSGTTGNPKGVKMTHTNLLFEGYAIEAVLRVHFGDRLTSFLPPAYIADGMTGLHIREMFGTQVMVVSDGRAIAAALPDVRPIVWGAVLRLARAAHQGEDWLAGGAGTPRRPPGGRSLAVGARRRRVWHSAGRAARGRS